MTDHTGDLELVPHRAIHANLQVRPGEGDSRVSLLIQYWRFLRGHVATGGHAHHAPVVTRMAAVTAPRKTTFAVGLTRVTHRANSKPTTDH